MDVNRQTFYFSEGKSKSGTKTGPWGMPKLNWRKDLWMKTINYYYR